MKIISIHPQYWGKIKSGEKTVEFRKNRMGLRSGDKVAIYCTAPVSAIVGYFTVGNISKAYPYVAWDLYNKAGGIAKEDFFMYYHKKETAFIFQIENYTPVEIITLTEIRKQKPKWNPPQSIAKCPVELEKQ